MTKELEILEDAIAFVIFEDWSLLDNEENCLATYFNQFQNTDHKKIALQTLMIRLIPFRTKKQIAAIEEEIEWRFDLE